MKMKNIILGPARDPSATCIMMVIVNRLDNQTKFSSGHCKMMQGEDSALKISLSV
jgi:hypothetical protein